MKKEQQQQLRANFELKSPLAQNFAKKLSNELDELLKRESVSLAVPIEFRVKSWESIVNKIESQKLELNEITDLDDLIGIRLILLFKRDAERACDVISSSFDVFENENTQSRLNVNEFGYQSVHFIIGLPSTWLKIPTFSDFEGLTSEIQVRTAAQHIWAAASHKLQYKQKENVPDEVLRSINRVSALLETVDLEFERTLKKRESYSDTGAPFDNDVPINVDNLRITLDKSLPKNNKRPDEPYDNLIDDLFKHDLKFIGDLNELIHSFQKIALSKDRKIARELNSRGRADSMGEVSARIDGKRYSSPKNIIHRGIFYSHLGLIRVMLNMKFSK